jgi:hypothetical protein
MAKVNLTPFASSMHVEGETGGGGGGVSTQNVVYYDYNPMKGGFFHGENTMPFEECLEIAKAGGMLYASFWGLWFPLIGFGEDDGGEYLQFSGVYMFPYLDSGQINSISCTAARFKDYGDPIDIQMGSNTINFDQNNNLQKARIFK